MKNWKLKSCKKCGGDLHLERDEYGKPYYICLQCAVEHNILGDIVRHRATGEEKTKGGSGWGRR